MTSKHESWTRSLVKSASWRIIAVLITFFIVLIWTNNLKESLTITIIIQAIKTLIYYFHERIWVRVGWGYKDNINSEDK